MEPLGLLRQLSEIHGPSGFEAPIASFIADLWRPLAHEVVIDRLGNVIALKRGTGREPRRRVLLAAHMDEIGLLVADIVESHGHGFLRVVGLGGVDIRQLYSQPVLVHGRRLLPGVLGGAPTRLLAPEKQSKAYELEDLVVDVGLPAGDVRELVQIGDCVSFQQPLVELRGGHVAGKALDNRACVAALTLALENLQPRGHSWDVLAVATVQEETRLLGAFTTAHTWRPDVALALDVCFGKGPGANDSGTIALGKGPVFDIGVNVHPGILEALEKAAAAVEIKSARLTHARGSGTDAYGLQVAHTGIPTGVVSLPLRYMHTMVEVVQLKDVERTGRLTAEFVARLDDAFMDNLPKCLME